MREISIPQASLIRLRAAYQQFMDTAAVISEAMSIPNGTRCQLVLERGVFVLEDDGETSVIEPARVDGVAEVTSA